MNRPAHPRMLMPLLSRFISRGGSARAGTGAIRPRLVAALAAAAIVFVAQASVRFESASADDALRVVTPAASFAALHSAPSHRLALESHSPSHSPSRRPASFAPALPSCSRVVVLDGSTCDAAIQRVSEHRITPAVARGYDATAPPALS